MSHVVLHNKHPIFSKFDIDTLKTLLNDSSIIYYDKSLEILKTTKQWKDYAWALISKSTNYYYLNDYKQFEKYLLVTQKLYETILLLSSF